MKTALSIMGVAAVAMLLYTSTNDFDGSQLFLSERLSAEEMTFLEWLNTHSKSYPTKEEYKFRFVQFKRHLAEIAAHDEQYSGHKVGLHFYSDNTEEEWKQMMGRKYPDGYQQPLGEEELSEEDKEAVLKIASSKDWRDSNVVTPVKNQGRCGSCWAFAAAAATESSYAQKSGSLLVFSEQQYVDCVRSGSSGLPCCWGCFGGLENWGWEWMIRNNVGQLQESQYPYTGSNSQQCTRPSSSTDQKYISSYAAVTRNADQLKLRLQTHVLTVGIEAENAGFRGYTGGVITSGCGTNLDHSVTVVGYGTDPSQGDYFIVKNSWGASWGESGYVRIAPNQCGIVLDAHSVNMQ